jgi:hypothetical protein
MNDDLVLRVAHNNVREVASIKLSSNGSYYIEFLNADGTFNRNETFGAGEPLAFFEEVVEEWKNGIRKQFLCE